MRKYTNDFTHIAFICRYCRDLLKYFPIEHGLQYDWEGMLCPKEECLTIWSLQKSRERYWIHMSQWFHMKRLYSHDSAL